MSFNGSNDPTNSIKALKKYSPNDQVSIPSGPSHRAHNNTTTMQHETKPHE